MRPQTHERLGHHDRGVFLSNEVHDPALAGEMLTSRPASVRFSERSEILDYLLEISVATSQTLDLEKLLQSVADIVRKVMPFDLFAILLYSERRKELKIRYAVGHRQEVVNNLVVKLGEGITGAAAELRDAILVGDVRKDSRYLVSVDAVRTELAVPMIARGRVVGVIDLQSTTENAYAEYDRMLMNLIASRMATAIDNASLIRRAERQSRTLMALSRLSQEFSSILEQDELLTKIASSVRRLIFFDGFSILLLDEEKKVLNHRYSQRYDERSDLNNIPLGKGITGVAALERQPIRVVDTAADPRYIASHTGVNSEMALPLILRDRVIGVMDLESNRIGYFTEDHVRTMMLLAPQIASSIENARLYEEIARREHSMQEDLKAARELQTVLVPQKAPAMKGLEVAISWRPARDVSGDIYDFFEHGHGKQKDGQIVVAFGDSSGKGAAAALYGAVVAGLLRTLAPRNREPAALLKALNDNMFERKVEARFVTLMLLSWHPHTSIFKLANAGSTLPLVYRRGKFLEMDVTGVPLGLVADQQYDEISFEVEPGDTIVLYSDGVSEHQGSDGVEFGRKRLAEVIRNNCQLPPDGLVQAILSSLDTFNTRRFDDQTVIVMQAKARKSGKPKAVLVA